MSSLTLMGVESNDFGIGIVLSDLIFVFVPLGTVGGYNDFGIALSDLIFVFVPLGTVGG